MSNIHNNGENDKSLDESLDKLGRAYEALPHDEPPELLDLAILNSAHRAVGTKPHWMKFGWLHGLTTAAVVVLALSIIINQREQVPVYERARLDNELSTLQREKSAKKQSRDAPSDDMRMELKEKSENRQDGFRAAPVPVAEESEAGETVALDRAAESEVAAQRSNYVQDSPQLKTDRIDKDVQSNKALREERLVDEADLVVETPDPAMASKPPQAAIVAEYSSGRIGVNAETAAEMEKLLQNIISLKQSGDEEWITQLELFKKNYPDYPLPEALSD